MKKLCSLLLCLALVLSMAACGAQSTPTNAPTETEATVQPETQPAVIEKVETPAEPEKVSSYTELVFASVESGPIVGFNYNGVNTFRGIPYATAKRFQAPEKVEPWTEVLPCFNWGRVAYSSQNDRTSIPFSEFMTPSDSCWAMGDDCQNVNIWTPSMDADEKLPVLVFLHGGDGNAQELVYYDGHNLADSGNLVFVTMNHREQLLGCMDLSAYGEEYKNSAFGEYLDIIAGLEWVRDNIANFGGDPTNVTLMGQSAGAGNVTRLMGMPAADGLYSKAVIHSSPNINDHSTITSEQTRAEGAAFMEQLGLTKETIGQLDELSYETLRDAAAAAGMRYGNMPADTGFFVDYPFTPDGEREETKSIPMILSGTYAEYADNFASQVMGYGYDECHRPQVDEAKVRELLEARYGENTDKVLELYEAAYPGRDPFYALYINTNRGNETNLYGVAHLRAANGGAPAYASVYSYCYPLFGGVVPVHTDGDIPLVFNNVDLIPEQFAGDEETAHKVASEASTALANFCRTGNPNGEGVPEWPAFDTENGTTMFYDRVSEARSGNADRDLLNFMRDNRIE